CSGVAPPCSMPPPPPAAVATSNAPLVPLCRRPSPRLHDSSVYTGSRLRLAMGGERTKGRADEWKSGRVEERTNGRASILPFFLSSAAPPWTDAELEARDERTMDPGSVSAGSGWRGGGRVAGAVDARGRRAAGCLPHPNGRGHA